LSIPSFVYEKKEGEKLNAAKGGLRAHQLSGKFTTEEGIPPYTSSPGRNHLGCGGCDIPLSKGKNKNMIMLKVFLGKGGLS